MLLILQVADARLFVSTRRNMRSFRSQGVSPANHTSSAGVGDGDGVADGGGAVEEVDTGERQAA